MADTEKITINLSAVDLGRIDLLADEGFYSHRTDFIRTAIRKELDAHREILAKSVVRRESALGVVVHTKKSLEACLRKKEKLELNVVGGVYLAKDISPELALATIKTLNVKGVLRATPAVRDVLSSRTH